MASRLALVCCAVCAAAVALSAGEEEEDDDMVQMRLDPSDPRVVSRCPFDQFEALRSSASQTLAWTAARSYTITQGPCAGTVLRVAPLGVYTTVMEITRTLECPREALTKAIESEPVLVPSTYFGRDGEHKKDEEDLVRFADFEPVFFHQGKGRAGTLSLPWALASEKDCGDALRDDVVLFHATFDFGTPNMWHSGAALHTAWSALRLMNYSRDRRDLDVVSGECHHYTPEGCRPGPSSTSNRCNCSLGDAVAGALGFPGNRTVRVLSKPRGCYATEMFALRHVKTHRSSVRSGTCEPSKNANWAAATGLLWDSKWCAGRFKCEKPSAWRSYAADLYASVRRTFDSFPDAQHDMPATLCYMSRGYNNTKRGFVDEAGMRKFVLEARASCPRRAVLDFTTHPVTGDFLTQAKLAAECAVLFGAHGAGMGHLIWMHPHSAAVLEIVPRNGRPYFFENLAMIAGARHEYFDGPQHKVGNSNMHDPPNYARLEARLAALCDYAVSKKRTQHPFYEGRATPLFGAPP